MPIAPSNGIELWYETFGDADDPALLLVMGLGGQAIGWDAELCEAFVDRGFFVIRFDNRDVGLSTRIDVRVDFAATLASLFSGQDVDVPYKLTDMAADAVGLLDHLGIDAAHVAGVSMGGMIAQTMAIEHPDRVLTLTSIMSTTGDLDIGQPTPEAAQVLLGPPPSDRASAIESGVAAARVINSPEYFDEPRVRERAAAAFDRNFHPYGVGRQLVAVAASSSRSDALRALDVPALVIHGEVDPLITVGGGRRTAEVIPGAELIIIEGMGHDLPPQLWPQIIEPVTRLAARVAAA